MSHEMAAMSFSRNHSRHEMCMPGCGDTRGTHSGWAWRNGSSPLRTTTTSARSRADGKVTLYMMAGCGPMSRESETVRPVRTSAWAWARLAAVIRLAVPRWSSFPQRPQLFSSLKYPSRRSCVSGAESAMVTAPVERGAQRSHGRRSARAGQTMLTRDFVRVLPKAEVHLHLEG